MLQNASGRTFSPNLLRAPDGRRLVIVISDCQADYWYEPEVWHLIRGWATSTATVIVNPLRSKHWRQTGLNDPAVRVFAGPLGERNTALAFDEPLYFGEAPHWTPVPVLALTSGSVGDWANFDGEGTARDRCGTAPSAAWPGYGMKKTKKRKYRRKKKE